jgi:hypothetical protein
MLSVRSPFGGWPAVLCAKSLRRSDEMAFKPILLRFWDGGHGARVGMAARPGTESRGVLEAVRVRRQRVGFVV